MPSINVADHIGLAKSIARKRIPLSNPAVDLEDCEQEAALAVVRAAKRFDPARGNQFSTYATHRAKGAVTDHLRRVSKYAGDVSLEKVNGETPTIDFPDELIENKDLVRVLLSKLTEVQASIVMAHIGGKTFTEIEKDLKIERHEAAKIYNESLMAMRAEAVKLGEDGT